MVEEASSRDNHSNHYILKSKITTKKQNVNRKGISQYQVNDYTDYIFSSNNWIPLPVKHGNRRLAVFDVNPEMRGNKTYFKNLANHMSKPIVKWAFYQFLRNLSTYSSPIEFTFRLVFRTENGSRNIPNIGKNVPDTMCGLGDDRYQEHFPTCS